MTRLQFKGKKPTPKTTHPNKKSLRKSFSELFVQIVLPLSFKQEARRKTCESSLRVCLAQFAVFSWVHMLQDCCPQQKLLWLSGLTIPQAIPEECPHNCWSCKTICPDKPLKLLKPHTQRPSIHKNTTISQHNTLEFMISCGQIWISGWMF